MTEDSEATTESWWLSGSSVPGEVDMGLKGQRRLHLGGVDRRDARRQDDRSVHVWTVGC